ncbi:hypothetical protein KSP40_PGU004947 [Platanthera guangdongensis]|uniref:Uncharacterized protein n=1 Tax=Platanthera guangdongensis TaxID=2320717 RepID=A0ABR2M7L6_9ASPA
MEGKRRVVMAEASIAALLLLSLSMKFPLTSARPMGEKLRGSGFEGRVHSFLQSLPQGPTTPSGPSCQTHGPAVCPPEKL